MVALLVLLAIVVAGVSLSASAARAAEYRVDLRVLVVSNGDPSVEAIATQLVREGVPFTKVLVNDPGRPVIDAAFLADASAATARYQAVVLPNQAGGGLTADETAALTAYERTYGVRQVSAYNWPTPSMGLNSPTYSGSLDGGSATVTAAGLAGPFGYLQGSLPVDDFGSELEVFGYLAQPVSPLPAGESFTPLLTASAPGGQSGVLAGVHAKDGREELVLTAAYNPYMQWWNTVAHGVVTWMTRGIHLGHQRNYLAVHIDDVFLPDSRWSVSGNCTPGDDCVDPSVTTEDIRMTSADVTRLLDWQNANDFKLDMVFNAGGIQMWRDEHGGADPLTDALLANQAQFPWINHTFTHPYMGCIQIAPTVVGQPWHCATSEGETPRQDPEIPAQESGGVYWASQEFLRAQVQDNITWAASVGLSDFDATELVTGEHSGLRTTPQQPQDNPFLGAALDQTGIDVTASDASREPTPRTVTGGGTVTLPRYPMNVYYNTGTYQDQIDEYNWYYNSRADGGSGICENNPLSTCIAPLPAGDPQEARASFDGYLQPLEVRNALGKVLTNDPRPFYAHQSNLAEDALLYPVVEGILQQYRATHAASAPVVRTDMTSQLQQLNRMAGWQSAAQNTTAYIDSSGVHVEGGGAEVPLTVPAGTQVNGAALESYGGELSAWVTGTVTAVPSSPMGGYVGTAATVPGAPVLGTVTAGDASATVTWTAPADAGESPITGYQVAVYEGDATQPARQESAAADATQLQVTGLTNGTAYSFTVAAVNGAGTGPASQRSAPVTPTAAPTVGSELAAGSQLIAGQALVSANGAFRADMQGDGNFVVYRTADGVPVWNSGTWGASGARVEMRADGNLAVVSEAGAVAWQSNTAGSGGVRAVLGDDGALTVQTAEGTVVWSSAAPPPPPVPPAQLGAGSQLVAGQGLVSANGSHRADMQGDGNFVVYRNVDGVPVWNSGTWNSPGAHVEMRADGNLAVVSEAGAVAWQSNTAGSGGVRAVLGDDGVLSVQTVDGTVVWSSAAPPPVTSPELAAGERLTAGQSLVSANGSFRANMQGDGNFVVYGPDGASVWAAGTWGVPGAHVEMRADGNLAVVSEAGAVAWQSNTAGSGGVRAVLGDDGVLSVQTAE
ncbi:fibronectin type III domain-containing protein, partial [Geodermatophilus sp. SYSU D00696]